MTKYRNIVDLERPDEYHHTTPLSLFTIVCFHKHFDTDTVLTAEIQIGNVFMP